jgi:hypothetical protein
MKAIGVIFIFLAIAFGFMGLKAKGDSEWWRNMSRQVSSHNSGDALQRADRHSVNMSIMLGVAGVLFVAGIIMVASGPTSTSPDTRTTPEIERSVEDKLLQLSALKAKGLLSEAEYLARRNELLNTLSK